MARKRQDKRTGWLADLKIGDEVCVVSTTHPRQPPDPARWGSLAEVSGVTASGEIVVNWPGFDGTRPAQVFTPKGIRSTYYVRQGGKRGARPSKKRLSCQYRLVELSPDLVHVLRCSGILTRIGFALDAVDDARCDLDSLRTILATIAALPHVPAVLPADNPTV